MTSTVTQPAKSGALERRNRGADLTFRQKLGRWDVKFSPYVYVAPFFILFGLVGVFPLVYTFVVSLNNWNLLTGPGKWVGFDNYAAELADPLFWNSIFNTFSIFLISAIPQLIGALIIAAVLDQNLRAKTFWRLGVLLPYVVTPVAVALIFSSVFSEKYGLVNNILQTIGIDPIMWKTELFPSHLAIASMINWRWTGYNALILLAAMQAVPKDVHEAAAIDGANAVQRFFSITIPSIRPTVIFVIITSTIGSLQIFTEPKLFNASSSVPGGPFRQYQTTVLYMWDVAFNRENFGKSAAIAWILFIIIVLIGLINFFLSSRIATSDSRKSQRRTARVFARARLASSPDAPSSTIARLPAESHQEPRS
ncbi:sugar ABC transporter permease [Lacisediminihabitans sp.]|jgi:cellobiose transport system permease protein|uniref:carbohydrate ABC transporter permease n=1 Tax=Lacisediminihabitans sp. TaxID=2787631 RepID=UPI002F92646E